ncbi:MAG: hypothetical protein M1546_09315, partial [Chloroflexi bacterium]|nr:hypothetical protein [Chloroflexota bacterium]
VRGAAVNLRGGRISDDDGGAQIVQGGRFAQRPHLGGEEAAQVDGEGDGGVEGGEVGLEAEEEMPGGIEAGAIGAGEAGQSGFGEGDAGIGLEGARGELDVRALVALDVPPVARGGGWAARGRGWVAGCWPLRCRSR